MGYRLLLLTLFPLLTVLQSPAQRHVKRPGKNARHISRLPDSVSTSEEEIKPFSPDASTSTGDAGVTESDAGSTQNKEDSVKIETENTDTAVSEVPEPPPVLRAIPDTTIRNWKNSHDFDYANDPSLWKKEPQKDGMVQRFFDSAAFRYTLYILLGAVLLFALYRIIAENNLRFFYKKPVRIKEKPLEEAELPEEDLDLLLKKAMEEKEYRMATRYLYLKTLRHLDALALIRWHSQATDEEYSRQMDGKPQGPRFRWLTTAYEKVWYGKFSLDERQFSLLSQYFQDFYNAVDHTKHS